MTATLQITPWVLVALLAAALWLARRRTRRLLADHDAARRSHARTLLEFKRIRDAVDSSSDAIGIGDFEGNSVYHNRAHVALFGYSVDELNAIPETGPLFADPATAMEIHRSIRAGHSWVGETDVRTKDGRHIPALVRADLILDDAGQPAGIFGVFTDITERRRQEALIAAQRQQLAVTLDSIGDGVITLDHEGHVLLANPAAAQLIGLAPEKIHGAPLACVLFPLDERTRAPRAAPALALLRQTRDRRSIDAYLVTVEGGGERLIAEIATLIDGPDGRPAGAVLALRDITRERRQAEELARAGKLESLGLLAGGIAHDFGNLLTIIIGNIGVARLDPTLPAAASSRLDTVERTAWRAHELSRQLLLYSRGEVPAKRTLRVGTLLQESVTLVASRHPGIAITFALAPDLWPVDADESQLTQVFNNLALNAIQAMEEKGRLHVAAANHDTAPGSASPRPARWLRITVTDTGPGIKPEHLSRIFDPFFTTKRTGTGLGLATCHSIARQHGGDLQAESAPGEGTTFILLLPRSPAASL